MPTYICPRCNYETKRLSSFQIHLNRKDVCEARNENVPIEELRGRYNDDGNTQCVVHCCEHCDKQYTSKSAWLYHLSKCTKKPSLQTILNDEIAQKDKIIADLREENKRLTDIVAQSNNTVTNTSITNNNLHIHINNFGHENTDYITRELALECLDKEEFGINRMINEIYFNKDHEENHNVRLLSLKHAIVEVFHDPNWISKGLFDTINAMINNSKDEIFKEAFNQQDKTHDQILTSINKIRNLDPHTKRLVKERTKASIVERRKQSAISNIAVT
jgi:hypothetical protein